MWVHVRAQQDNGGTEELCRAHAVEHISVEDYQKQLRMHTPSAYRIHAGEAQPGYTGDTKPTEPGLGVLSKSREGTGVVYHEPSGDDDVRPSLEAHADPRPALCPCTQLEAEAFLSMHMLRKRPNALTFARWT